MTEGPDPLPDIEHWRTDAPEATIRDLMRRFGKVWVRQVYWTDNRQKIKKRLINDLNCWAFNKVTADNSFEHWHKHGGIVLQSYVSRRALDRMPTVPALLLMECPLSLEELAIASLQAARCVVIRTPPTWEFHRRLVQRRHPGREAGEAFIEWLVAHHQRFSDLEARFAAALGHDTATICPVSSGEYVGASQQLGEALDIMPNTGQPLCVPVRLMAEPEHEPLLGSWRVVKERAPEVDGWHLATGDLFELPVPWQSHLLLMERMGYVRRAMPMYFMSVAREPDFDAAELVQRKRLAALERIQKVVARWKEYPHQGLLLRRPGKRLIRLSTVRSSARSPGSV
jgi:hypothetical protein